VLADKACEHLLPRLVQNFSEEVEGDPVTARRAPSACSELAQRAQSIRCALQREYLSVSNRMRGERSE